MAKDDLCPTCGSKNFKSTDKSTVNEVLTYKNECNNCKKFWYV